MRDGTLLLSWTIPPETSGSAIIVGNLARQFARDEMVVAGEHPWGRPAVAWRAEWPELVYVIAGWPPGLRGARWWRWLQFPVLLLRSLQLARKHQCRAVLVVFPKEDFLLAGYLTALWTGARLVPYFHNTYVENRTGVSLRFARWLQARVFARAEHVFVMSEGMADLFRERYPGLECSTLPHSFSEEIPQVEPPPRPSTRLRLAICGSINESCREASVRACAAIAQVGDAVLTILSGTPEGYLRRIGILRNGTRHETVSRDHVIARLRDADIVVLAHGFHGSLSAAEYRTIFPTKTIEYLICGRPILAHAPADCYLSRFLTEHDCALVVTDPSTQALVTAIERLRDDAALRSRLVRNALEAAKVFRAPRVAAILRTQLQRS
jgi:glycosyltransferase involved in cell wall biosynthesis